MKFYYPFNHYNSLYRKHLFPLLRRFVVEEKNETRFLNNSDPDMGCGFFYTDQIDQADIVILTMSWNYYKERKQQSMALNLINSALKKSTKVWVVLSGDYGINLPDFKNVKLFRVSGYKSKLPKWHVGMPVFITDPLRQEFSNSDLKLSTVSKRPSIGFCGLASGKNFYNIKIVAKILIKNLAFILKVSNRTREKLYSPPYIRYKCLKRLQNDERLITNFILRDKYRGGASTNRDRERTTNEYFDNMIDSQYILCIRGAGNFSARIYETLALGRIPIYLNTDGLLPHLEEIEWKKHVVWVEWEDRHKIGDKVLEFHQKLSNEQLQELGISNRKLWLSHFQIRSFFQNQIKK